MSGLFNKIFGGTPQVPTNIPAPQGQQAAQQTPGTPGNIPNAPNMTGQTGAGTDPNGVVPNNVNQTQDPTPKEPESPLDKFKDLWEPVTTKADDTNTPEQLDPSKLQELVSKADFTKGINPEHMAAIVQGGEGAVEAFAQSMNEVARQVLVQATLASNKMTEQAVARATEAMNAKFPELVKNLSLSDSLATSNPIFQNPAIKPVIEATKSMLVQKYPNASNQDISKMVVDYVSAMGETFAPKQQSQSQQAAQDSVDWDKFLEM